MTNLNKITINYTKRAIEISKSFAKASSIFGSEAYNELKEAKNDFPTFRVVVKTTSKRSVEDRITMDDIIRYVATKSGENSEQMETLKELRGVSLKDSKDIFTVEESASFMQIKKWFFATYPEVAKRTDARKKKIDEIIANAVANNKQSA